MRGQLAGKVALISGANIGIGRCAALLFAREGAKVLVCARNAAEAEAVAAEARELGREAGGDASFFPLDVRDRIALQNAVDAAVNRYGGLHVAFNNAGVSGRLHVPLVEQDEADFDHVIEVNLRAVFVAMKVQLPAIIASGGGSIINNSSVGGIVGRPGMSPVIASKHGVIGLTRAAALEYASQGVRVNAICPSATETRIMLQWLEDPAIRARFESSNPMGRLAKPEEQAQAALWLASDASSFVTGAVIPVDGGVTAA